MSTFLFEAARCFKLLFIYGYLRINLYRFTLISTFYLTPRATSNSLSFMNIFKLVLILYFNIDFSF